jgi:hypothetical protein
MVREILHARVLTRPRERQRVELLGDVDLPRVDVHRDRGDAREVEEAARGEDLRRARHRVAEADVDAGARAVDLARERRLHPEALAFADKALVLDRWMPRIGLDGEGQEVAVEGELARVLQGLEQAARVS